MKFMDKDRSLLIGEPGKLLLIYVSKGLGD